MFKQTLFLFAFVYLSLLGVKAQVVPSCSTAENPIWYYLSIQEETDGPSLYFTVDGEYLYGRALATDESELATQLWRFEAEEDGSVSLVNKSVEGYLNFQYQSTLMQSLATISSKKLTFTFQARGEKYALRATTLGAGDACYLGISPSESMNKQFVELTEDFGNKPAVIFDIQIYNDSPIKETVKGDENWYYLLSAKNGVTGEQAICDNTKNEGGAPLTVVALEESNEAQQWKLVRNEATGNYMIVNRATGLHILSNSIVQDIYNITSAGWVSNNPGFEMRYLGLGQYAFCGVEDDGIMRYLSIQDASAPAESLNLSAMPSSSCAWTLKVAGHSTGVKDAIGSEVNVKVVGKRIGVEGADDYRVVNALGMDVPKSSALSTGIYLVVIGENTYKVTVK